MLFIGVFRCFFGQNENRYKIYNPMVPEWVSKRWVLKPTSKMVTWTFYSIRHAAVLDEKEDLKLKLHAAHRTIDKQLNMNSLENDNFDTMRTLTTMSAENINFEYLKWIRVFHSGSKCIILILIIIFPIIPLKMSLEQRNIKSTAVIFRWVNRKQLSESQCSKLHLLSLWQLGLFAHVWVFNVSNRTFHVCATQIFHLMS